MAWNPKVINLDDAITRAMGRKELYKGWLDSFFEDKNFAAVEEAFRDNNYQAAESVLHKMKGTAGNLSIMILSAEASALHDKVTVKTDFAFLAEDLQKLRESFFDAKKMYTDNIEELLSYGEI
jgi:HPt (histidine-containing phosphotransfer) domain-containing protein